MSDVWRCAVSIDSVAIVSGNTAGTGVVAATGGRAVTTNDTVSGAGFAIHAALAQDFSGGTGDWQSIYYAKVRQSPGDPLGFATIGGVSGWQQVIDPATGFPLTVVEPSSAHGASWLAGGTLAITKDFDAGHLVFETPFGNMTAPFSWFTAGNGFNPVFTPDAQPLFGDGMGHRLTRDNSGIAQSLTQKWYNFYTYKNGVQVFGWALSAADPGSWGPFVKVSYNGLTFMVTDDAQELTRYRTRFTWALADDTPLTRDTDCSETRFVIAPPPAFGLDLTELPAHAQEWGVWTPSTCTCVRVRRSHDSGHSWTEYVPVAGTDTVVSPTIATFAGAVYVLYYDETSVQSLLVMTADNGSSWSSPVPVSITGTNPRLVISPEGIFFFFSLSSGNIVLQRSMDLGSTLFDAAPITVATTVPTQDFAAVLSAAGSVLVAYADSLSNWVTRASFDLGVNWQTM